MMGALFGVLPYVINFDDMTHLFPWFADARGWVTLLNHVLFGMVAADSYLALQGT
jgi:hypothetical protein